jgi:CcmD family protein
MQARKIALTLLILVLIHSLLPGQTAGEATMTSNGKIYVVVAVILTVFVGIVLFLLFLDRRLTKIENQINEDA